MPPGALDGLLVADFSRVLAGPLCTQTLGDLGADVVKVERPGAGDDTRTWGPPFVEQGATYYLGLNRNKRSVTLDLADPADAALARTLAARADVLVESFRPGTIDRLGLGYEDVAASATLASSTARSAHSGPESRRRGCPATTCLLQAMSGLMSVTGEPDGRPLKVGAALIDMVCGLYATTGVLAALQARERTGRGQRVEVSLMDSALAGLLNQASAHLLAGVVPGRLGNRHPSIAPYETFRASDGDFAVAVGNDAIFARLCAAIGRPELAGDARFATNAARLERREELARDPRGRVRRRHPPPTGCSGCRRPESRPGPSTTSAGHSRSPRRSVWSPVGGGRRPRCSLAAALQRHADRGAPCARPRWASTTTSCGPGSLPTRTLPARQQP